MPRSRVSRRISSWSNRRRTDMRSDIPLRGCRSFSCWAASPAEPRFLSSCVLCRGTSSVELRSLSCRIPCCASFAVGSCPLSCSVLCRAPPPVVLHPLPNRALCHAASPAKPCLLSSCVLCHATSLAVQHPLSCSVRCRVASFAKPYFPPCCVPCRAAFSVVLRSLQSRPASAGRFRGRATPLLRNFRNIIMILVV